MSRSDSAILHSTFYIVNFTSRASCFRVWVVLLFSSQLQAFAGDHGGAAIPVPIPNTEVKRSIAEGSAGPARARVGRRRLFFRFAQKSRRLRRSALACARRVRFPMGREPPQGAGTTSSDRLRRLGLRPRVIWLFSCLRAEKCSEIIEPRSDLKPGISEHCLAARLRRGGYGFFLICITRAGMKKATDFVLIAWLKIYAM